MGCLRKARCSALMVVLGVAILGSTIAVAQVPETLAYQGHLKGRDGISLSGNYDISFALYDQRSGGTALWQETHSAVPIQNGRFQVELGSVVSFASADVVFDQQYFLGITVGTDSEMTPRLPLNSVVYAFNALGAENAERAVHSQDQHLESLRVRRQAARPDSEVEL